MNEQLRGKGIWIGLGGVAIIFLCLMLCGMGAMVTLFTRPEPAYAPAPYVQPPSGEEGVAPPPSYYHGGGPLGKGAHGHGGPFGFFFGAIGMLFKLAFFGLLLLLLIGFVKRLMWGPRHWSYKHCGPHHWGKPPKGKEWKGRPHPPWGPWAWHGHAEPRGAEGEPADQENESDSDQSEYNGPQE
jgi:hypothetical protein